jgi:hypothetical protein
MARDDPPCLSLWGKPGPCGSEGVIRLTPRVLNVTTIASPMSLSTTPPCSLAIMMRRLTHCEGEDAVQEGGTED